MQSGVGRRVVGWGLALGLTLGAGRAVVALPEQCGQTTSAERRAAAAAAVGWFSRTQRPDGTFLYRYDAAADTVLDGYNWVRHAGVLMSLEQARGAGVPGAAEVAESGLARVLDEVIRAGDRAALADGGAPTTGGSALLAVALSERREHTGATEHDELLAALGRFLVSTVAADGTVAERADASTLTPVPKSVSRFTTGEVAFALARLENVWPGEGWGDPVRRITRYLALDKAEQEGFVPDMADHWGAYALAEVVSWDDAELSRLTDWEVSWARKQAGMLSVMVRFESQRSNSGLDRWLRGRTSVGSAVGTHGESMSAWAAVAAGESRLHGSLAGTLERLSCNAGLLADRQVGTEEAAGFAQPSLVEGTWLWFGVTQMDDQQHALSALLGAESRLDAGGVLPRRDPVPSSAWLVAAVVLFVVNPVRFGCGAPTDRRKAAAGIAVAAATVAVIAALGATLLEALDVSVPTAVVAAGLAVVVGGVVTALHPGAERGPSLPGWGAALVPAAVPLLLRPELAVLALAAGPGGRTVAVVAGLVAAGAIGLVARPVHEGRLAVWAVRATGVLAVALGVFLLVDGVFAV
ncbi:MAG: hypothetical protein IPM43_02085 [Actinomycetota bacterium]|nr:MAG: hypothetical protein IPM43_02085 [Actinomycetota bacterium]